MSISGKQRIIWHKVARIVFMVLVLFLIIREGGLVYMGYPSSFDYQSFKLTTWLSLIINYTMMEFAFYNKHPSFATLKKKPLQLTFYILIFVFIFGGLILLRKYEDKINSIKYNLPLVELETHEISGNLNQNALLISHEGSGELHFKNPIHLKEYPETIFNTNTRQLLNSINTLDNYVLDKDTLHLMKGQIVKFKVRKTDYERMKNQETDNSFFLRDRFDWKKINIYELTYQDKVIFKKKGVK